MIERLMYHNVVKEGHWKLTSGNHSNIYCNKDTINQHPSLRFEIHNVLTNLVQQHRHDHDYADIVITGPAVSGAIIASPIAIQLDIPFVYPEKTKINDKDAMEFRRGYDKFIKGKQVILIEDIISSGKSVNLTIDAVERCGGKVIYVASIWNRTATMFKCPSDSLINEEVKMWSPEECPLCEKGLLLYDPKTNKVIGDPKYDKLTAKCTPISETDFYAKAKELHGLNLRSGDDLP